MNGEEEGFISLKFIRNLGFLRTKDTDSVLMYTIRSDQLQFIHSGDYTQYNPEDPDHAYREHAYGYWHRRGINKEEKAKVVAAVWGTELINFLAALAATIFAFSSCSICPSSLVIGYVTSFLPHFGLCENAILYTCTLYSNAELLNCTVQ